tara:strand:+ start:523 stop:666 length:144 start_codon:yes stop_codon:yes gene_type:complete
MKAIFTSKQGHRVTVEPMKKQSEEQLLKKAKQIMAKRGITSKIIIEC